MTLQQDLRDTLAGVARALGNGHRLALLERLAQGDAPVEALANATGLSVANASQHLQQLRRAGLVTASRHGRQMHYRLTDERIVDLMGLLRQIAETNLAETERLLSRLFADDDADGALEPVSRSELLAGLQSGRMVVLDVRPEAEFEAGHLPAAISMPLARLDDLLDRLPRDREIVAYCRGPWCALSHEAVQRLRRDGYRVRRFEEGYPEWKAAGLPVTESGRPAWATTS
jgi:ArsR family transcriptional regulator